MREYISYIIDLIIIVILILLNAFFAAAEIALASVRRARIQQLVDEGNRGAAIVARLISNPGQFLATIQIVITISGFFASAFGAVSLVVVLASLLTSIPLAFVGQNAATISLVIVTTLLAFVSLLFGELVPKNFAIQQAEPVALRVGPVIDLMARLARPLVLLLTWSSNRILRLFGQQMRTGFPTVTADEIRTIVETAEDEGVINANEGTMIDNIFAAGERRVRDVIIPRVDVVAVPDTATVSDARRVILQSGHLRLPAYHDTIDNVTGIIHGKDLLANPPAEQQIRAVPNLIRSALYIPETRNVNDCLNDLRQQRTHMAVVVDEFGGTVGVVTLEDLLEEIVGPINDESDHQEVPEIVEVDEQTLIVDGSLPLTELEEVLDLTFDTGTYKADTVAGLIYSVLGVVPEQGQVVDLPQARLTVLQMRNRRIERVEVQRKQDVVPDA